MLRHDGGESRRRSFAVNAIGLKSPPSECSTTLVEHSCPRIWATFVSRALNKGADYQPKSSAQVAASLLTTVGPITDCT